MPQSDADLLETREGHAACVRTVKTYDRIAPIYDLLDAVYEHSWKRNLRRRVFEHAGESILDVGVGTGCNMRFYPKGAAVVGIDSSRAMLERAAERAVENGQQVQLLEMNLLDLGFENQRFDTVVATFVLLCLPDELQLAALRELHRVLKPDGRLLILDYKMSERPGVRLAMRCIGPWLKWAFGGRYDAGTAHYVEEAGFQTVGTQSFALDSVSLMILEPVRSD
jgi:ubiquinone/menaquinone biosynthesis C-methylase UbiE